MKYIGAVILGGLSLVGCATQQAYVPGSSMMNGLYNDRATRRAADTIEGYLAKAAGACPVAHTKVIEPPRSVEVDFAQQSTATRWVERWRVDCAEQTWSCDLAIAAAKSWSSSSPDDIGMQIVRCGEVAREDDRPEESVFSVKETI